MFQSFDDIADPSVGAPRTATLRAELARVGLDGFIVPHADEFQNEYLPAASERLAWLTGFSGSAGLAVVLVEKAAIFVDGRYTLQVRDQVDVAVYSPEHLVDTPPAEWLARNAAAGARIGYDPWLHTGNEIRKLAAACEKAGASLVPVAANPLDAVWTDRPAPPASPVVDRPLEFAGRSRTEKLAELDAILVEKGLDAALLTDPTSLAWAFNIRGTDVPHTPLVLAFAVLVAKALPRLLLDRARLDATLAADLETVAEIRAPQDFADVLDALGKAGAKVLVDPAGAPHAIGERLTAAGATLVPGADPCTHPKAIKNEAEIAGARAAHVRDGAAMVRFLAWLEGEAPGTVDEIAAAERLEAFRRDGGLLKDLSFDTISGAGPNGAIVHYRVTRATSRVLDAGSVYLVDSGGQYVDGTTDITRTVAIGEPSAEMRDRFTRVLKGHIGIAAARFPEGTTGAQLDTLARYSLWQAGLDYDHGTGHGVGSFLSVHEGPQRISKAGSVKLEPGMIVSNEPGYYKTGAYGIRIENLVLVRPAEEVAGGEKKLLSFETLTVVPIDRRLVDVALLTAEERAWLDAYHGRVRETISPLVDGTARVWLDAATAPL